MTQHPITLSRPLTNQLLSLAQSAGSRGMTGVISGKHGQLIHFHAINGCLESAEDIFGPQLAALGESITATVHSYAEGLPTLHCDRPPMSLKPELPHLIVTTNIKGVLEMRAFALSLNGKAQEIPLILGQFEDSRGPDDSDGQFEV